MTYRLQMQGTAKRFERERQERLSAVWHTVTLPGMKPFPSHSAFTGAKPVIRKQTPAEMKAAFASIREALKAGG